MVQIIELTSISWGITQLSHVAYTHDNRLAL
jgi:hypothetical protein